MRALIIAFALLLVGFNTALANKRQLSEQAEISLLTCSPGSELYSVFGHSAIRVCDQKNNIDWVFNYGMFDFDTPNFYLKFSSGRLMYWVAVYDYSRFVQSYFRSEQNVYEQVLNLDITEKQALFMALITNAQTENKYYRYDFFFDNCATRIRDIVIDNIGGNVQYNKTFEPDLSFRTYLHFALSNSPWTSDGLDLLLGVKADAVASVDEQMFLPKYMMQYFSAAEIVRGGESKSLVKETRQILKFDKNQSDNDLLTPDLFFWILFCLSLILIFFEIVKRKKPFVFLTRLLLFIVGCAGVLFFYLWFLSLHSVTDQNFNLLWAMPTSLLLAFIPLKNLAKGFFRYLLIITSGLLVVNVLIMFLIPQYLPTFILPLSALIVVRLLHLLTYIRK